ncbi:MAG: type I 3-dehydroquinate dehydratase [Candidatus Aminicenantes bacterium]|nr:type I 3-dehydroquinate dehydratase [Candidatus Aminicenantes bacterium]NIM83206.1 type I 3-dehydroquinate dehydratase [Candidatus Aminicenantes bacterium]NIN22592.1 type I 3-dehydroquinate dehydratase [Candidatus Aminicenantes bacterium]NIN46354.1 type I 3-dehydroquinate dehydratase [Candidatus Aminicenantes bacterium]NIN89202.1 type I 3-dehydroquinate dehydratase [Candidatus Aminicenantes bacterium]
MICICIGEPTVKHCKKILLDPDVEMAEIRLDGAYLSANEIQTIFSLHPRLIATCRPGNHTGKERKKVLVTAIIAGAAFVDIEIEADPAFKEELIQIAHVQGCQVILSYHNFETTPPRGDLETIVNQCISDGADIVKVACQVHSVSHCLRLLSLYDFHHPEVKIDKETGSEKTGDSCQIIAIGMGEKGKITRVAAPFLGAPFTYASIVTGLETAPGQVDADTLGKIYRLLSSK